MKRSNRVTFEFSNEELRELLLGAVTKRCSVSNGSYTSSVEARYDPMNRFKGVNLVCDLDEDSSEGVVVRCDPVCLDETLGT